MNPRLFISTFFNKLTEYWLKQRMEAEKWNVVLTPYAEGIYCGNETKRQTLNAQTTIFSTDVSVVTLPDRSVLHVNKTTRICTCGQWQHYKIPCIHALEVVRCLQIPPCDLFSDKYFGPEHLTCRWKALYDQQSMAMLPASSDDIRKIMEEKKLLPLLPV